MDWARLTLDPASRSAIAAHRWRRFPENTVVAIAEAWNAGLTTAQMAEDLRCTPATLRILIGRLTQIGVKLRKASDRPATGATVVASADLQAWRPAPAAATPPRRFSWEGAA